MNWQECKTQIINSGGSLPEDCYILGIDLGTTNSIISYWDNNSKAPVCIDISNGFGKIPLPSVVQYRKEEGEWVIGEEAYRSMKLYPESTIRSVKRKMGQGEKVQIFDKEYTPEEISAKILHELVSHCQSLNPKAEIGGLVVSVPYDFDDSAKKATMAACDAAGLSHKLICLIEEPKAAALAYNFRHQLLEGEIIMVFDFGGGTLDITLFKVVEKNPAHTKLQVISEGGEAYHGGDNVDEILEEKLATLVFNKTKQPKEALAVENQVELTVRAREAKERLSGVKNFRIPFTFCIPPFVEQVSRDSFEGLIEPFIDKTRALVVKALREAYTGPLSPDSVTRVLLEGGSSQMPWVKEMLLGIFNDESKIYQSERPALDISLGATYYAAMKMGLLSGGEFDLDTVEFEVCVPHDIGFLVTNGEKKSFYTMIRRGTPYPLAKKSQIFTLSGNSPEDMTTFSLTILERIHKEDKLSDCKLIGEVEINGLPERPSGKTKLEITLIVKEEGGLLTGRVEDLGFQNEYEKSGFVCNFEPSRFKRSVLNGGNV